MDNPEDHFYSNRPINDPPQVIFDTQGNDNGKYSKNHFYAITFQWGNTKEVKVEERLILFTCSSTCTQTSTGTSTHSSFGSK